MWGDPVQQGAIYRDHITRYSTASLTLFDEIKKRVHYTAKEKITYLEQTGGKGVTHTRTRLQAVESSVAGGIMMVRMMVSVANILQWSSCVVSTVVVSSF